LEIDELLSLQLPKSDGPEHVETLFIIIHQVYELLFKQVLHELDHAIFLLQKDQQVSASKTLKRVLTVFKNHGLADGCFGNDDSVGVYEFSRVS